MAKRILVIDDEVDFMAIMKLTLENNGFEVITAYDGQEGFSKAREERPDLIILDVLMPKIMGDELLNLFEREPETENTPVILLTNLPLMYLTGKMHGGPIIEKDSKGHILLRKDCSEEQLLAAIEESLQK